MNVHPTEIAVFFGDFQNFEGILNETQSGFALLRQLICWYCELGDCHAFDSANTVGVSG